jgi:multiple sugar transport system permease protein
MTFVIAEAGTRAAVRRTLATRLALGIGLLALGQSVRGHGPFLSVPIIWPVLPFSAWAALGCILAAIYLVLKSFISGQITTRPVIWLMPGVLFFVIFRYSGDKAWVAQGSIPMSPLAAVVMVFLASVATFAMANTHRAVRSQKFAKGLAVHIALLIGSLIFGIPLAWLLITSFKEERDMASPSGLVWIPYVQETAPTFDAIPALYETSYMGRTVRGSIMKQLPDGEVRIDVIEPDGIQGLALERAQNEVKRVPSQAPLVQGTYHGQTVIGLVLKEFDDGRQQVRISKPVAVAGQEFVAQRNDLQPVRHPGLRFQNYTDALGYLPPEADDGLVFVKNSLIIVVMSVIGTILSSSLVAYAFSRMRFPGRDILFGLLLSTMMLPSAVTLLPKFLIFRNLGWIDTLLPLWAPAFFASAFNVFLLRQFFKNIPTELEDAAKIDGCSYVRSYWSVMMPQIRPALAVIAIWTFIGAWNDFMGPLIYLNSPENLPVSYAVQIFSTDHGTLPGLTMAIAVMAVIPVILLFFFAQRFFIDGVTLSGFGGR